MVMVTSGSRGDGVDVGDVAQHMEELAERIRAADYAYYVLDAPILPDAEYDALMR